MKTIRCQACNHSLDVANDVYDQLKICPFCMAPLQEARKPGTYTDLGAAINAAVQHIGKEVLTNPRQLSGFLSDTAPTMTREIRIFSRTFANSYSNYTTYLVQAFELEPADALLHIKKLRHLLIMEEGLSDQFADIICNAIYSASLYNRNLTPPEENVFSTAPTPSSQASAIKKITQEDTYSIQKASPVQPSSILHQKPSVSGISATSSPAAPSIDDLEDRGFKALENHDWKSASVYFKDALMLNSRSGNAYLGLAMVDGQCENWEAFRAAYTFPNSLLQRSNNVMRAKQCGNPKLVNWFRDLDQEARRNLISKEHADSAAKLSKPQVQNNAHPTIPELRTKLVYAHRMISCGELHSVALTETGEVIATGANSKGQCDTTGWKNIINISAGPYHTIGLADDGTARAVGEGRQGQCQLNYMRDLVAVAAGYQHSVGVRADGTVIAVGNNEYGQCNVSKWRDIIAVSADYWHTVGLRKDGTVVAVGQNNDGECHVSSWHNVVDVVAGFYTTIGLKDDGTVYAIGNNGYGQCNVSNWSQIVAIAGNQHTVGLRADGTVIATGNNRYGQCNVGGWRDIIAIAAGSKQTLGLRSDGIVLGVGTNEDGQLDLVGRQLFARYTWTVERKERERQERIQQLQEKRAQLQAEAANVSGLFAKSRRSSIENSIANVEQKLKLAQYL